MPVRTSGRRWLRSHARVLKEAMTDEQRERAQTHWDKLRRTVEAGKAFEALGRSNSSVQSFGGQKSSVPEETMESNRRKSFKMQEATK